MGNYETPSASPEAATDPNRAQQLQDDYLRILAHQQEVHHARTTDALDQREGWLQDEQRRPHTREQFGAELEDGMARTGEITGKSYAEIDEIIQNFSDRAETLQCDNDKILWQRAQYYAQRYDIGDDLVQRHLRQASSPLIRNVMREHVGAPHQKQRSGGEQGASTGGEGFDYTGFYTGTFRHERARRTGGSSRQSPPPPRGGQRGEQERPRTVTPEGELPIATKQTIDGRVAAYRAVGVPDNKIQRILARVYHPDTESGSTEAMKYVNGLFTKSPRS